MTNTWQEFSQVSASMQVAQPDGIPPVGLSSDAEELRRAGLNGVDVDFEALHELTGIGPDAVLGDGDSTIGTGY